MDADERTRLLPAEGRLPAPEGAPGKGHRDGCLGTARLARLVTFSSSFSEGWDMAIFSLILVPVSRDFGLTPTQVGLLASLPLLAGVLGYLVMGWVMDCVGRKPTIIATYAICCLGCVIMSSAPGLLVLGLGRSVLALGIKAGVTCVSVYMTELAPAGHRGVLVSLEEIYINIGILSATVAAWALMGLELVSWRAFVGLGALAPGLALACVLLLRVPESPRFLQRKGRRAEALEVLRSALRDDEDEVARTLAHWQQEDADVALESEKTWAERREEFARLFAHKGFWLAAACWLARAGSGIAAIPTYITLFLMSMGQEESLRWFMIGAVAKTLALIPPVLWLIDCCGRRGLFLASAACCGASLAAVAASILLAWPAVAMAAALVCYFISFSIGYGPVVWVYCFEILPGEQRGRAAAFSMLPGDAVGFVLMTITPVLYHINHALPFIVMTTTNFVAFVFFWASCPETAGLLLEEAKDVVA